MVKSIILLTLTALLSLALAAEQSHLVRDLPGQPSVEFKHYAGWIPLHAAGEKALFYWFFEADHTNASSLPLVLWFNGGPGCSSVGGGALEELGPFRVIKGQQLALNPYSWNKAANMIFLEAPAGVGFSYSKGIGAYSDDNTATEALTFLVEWLKKFPDYGTNEFYIAGESYAGHYIPTLASKILDYNKNKRGAINFKGFAIGNPLTDVRYEAINKLHFLVGHSIIPQATYASVIENCYNSFVKLPDCAAVKSRVVELTEHINRYNVYKKNCRRCQRNIASYLNSDNVQAALNLDSANLTWVNCNHALKSQYSTNDRNASMIPLYVRLLKTGIRIWIYNGDFDTVVPALSTQAWITELRLTVQTPWYAWKSEKEVGGWSEIYAGLTFSTVRGAGHKVPADQPGPALAIFRSFLQNKPLPAF